MSSFFSVFMVTWALASALGVAMASVFAGGSAAGVGSGVVVVFVFWCFGIALACDFCVAGAAFDFC